MNKQLIPKKNDSFMIEEFDNEVLLYHPEKNFSFYLNPQAAVIWELCDGENSVQNIIDVLVEAFPEAVDQMDNDVVSSIEQFVEHDAISIDTIN